MNISRDLALEIFGLKDDFSIQELNYAYRKLAKITHPDRGGDKNLFIFIKECKDILDNKPSTTCDSYKNNNPPQHTKSYSKKTIILSIQELQDNFLDLDSFIAKYNIVVI